MKHTIELLKAYKELIVGITGILALIGYGSFDSNRELLTKDQVDKMITEHIEESKKEMRVISKSYLMDHENGGLH